MKLSLQLTRNDIAPQLRRYAAEMRKTWPAVVRQAARGVTRILLDITPPASGGSKGLAARRIGEAKIGRQMAAVFAPVRLKGRRTITHVFGRKLRRPVTVPTKERHPDVAAEYRSRIVPKGDGFGFSTGRPRAKLYVSSIKFKALFSARAARVGRLASGWGAVAQAVDVPLQAWIGRHAHEQRGAVQIHDGKDDASVVARNLAPGVPPGVRSELARRIPAALRYQLAAMERAIVGYHERVRGSLGIRGKSRSLLV